MVAGLVVMTGCGEAGGPVQLGECTLARVPYPSEAAQTGSTEHVHDPEIAVAGDAYYVFSTNDGIPIRRSTDLLSWEWLGRVFPNQLPSWATEEVPGVEAPWAPGIAYFNGRYHLYYSLSTFGSQRSVIGLTTNATLDPDAAGYGWEDQGKVLESNVGDEYNAIDPAVVEAADGSLWLAWGSWWEGIRMRELDPATGKLLAANDSLYRLARRPLERAIEAPYVVRRGAYYYLFVSFDHCCQGTQSTYNVRVGRSPAVTGPYVDRDGVPMMDGGGTMVLDGYSRIRGPGHASVLRRGDELLLVHHFYDASENGVPHLQIRPLVWDDAGWPLAGLAYDGAAPDPNASPVAEWGYWVADELPTRVTLHADGTVEACDDGGQWQYEAPTLRVEWSDGRVDRSTMADDGDSFVGRDPEDRIVRAYRLDE